MDNREENTAFHYTYSAKQQEEVWNIRKKYVPPEEDKMEQLRRLDRSVTQKATVRALIIGCVGALLLGVGMSCTLVWAGAWFVPGIAIGCVGIAAVCCAYPVYTRSTKRERAKLAPEILRLTDELLK